MGYAAALGRVGTGREEGGWGGGIGYTVGYRGMGRAGLWFRCLTGLGEGSCGVYELAYLVKSAVGREAVPVTWCLVHGSSVPETDNLSPSPSLLPLSDRKRYHSHDPSPLNINNNSNAHRSAYYPILSQAKYIASSASMSLRVLRLSTPHGVAESVRSCAANGPPP